MNISDEIKALKSVIEISKNPLAFKKKQYLIAFIYLLISSFLALYVILFSKNTSGLSAHALSFFSGMWLFWSYVKITEVYGFNFIIKYLDTKKIKQLSEELENNPQKGEKPISSPKSIILNIIIWAVIAYGVLSFVNYIKNV